MAAEVPSVMRAVVARDGKCVLDEARPVPAVGPTQVLVRMHATAINRADTLQRKGLYPVPAGQTDIMGLEVAGEVVAAGADCATFAVGDRVMALTGGGGNAEYTLVEESHCMRIPEGMSYTKAAGVPETWLTAYQLLFSIAGVGAGDTVLVPAAGSGVGTAAIQLAVDAGARVVALAGAQAKLDNAMALGATAAFNYKEGAWADKVLDATEGKGVTVILDCVGASFWADNIKAAATDARWVLYGLMGGAAVPTEANVLGALLRKRIRLQGTTLRGRTDAYKADLVAAFAAHALDKFAAGTFAPVFDDKRFRLAEVQAAHEHMESNAGMGKIIITEAED